MVPPAPGRFSTTAATPQAAPRCCAIRRPRISVLPPGVYGTMIRMGLDGYVSPPVAAVAGADASRLPQTTVPATRRMPNRCLIIFIVPIFESLAHPRTGIHLIAIVCWSCLRYACLPTLVGSPKLPGLPKHRWQCTAIGQRQPDPQQMSTGLRIAEIFILGPGMQH